MSRGVAPVWIGPRRQPTIAAVAEKPSQPHRAVVVVDMQAACFRRRAADGAAATL